MPRLPSPYRGAAVLASGVRALLSGRPLLWLWRRVRSVLGPGHTARQSLVSLAINSTTSFIAGAVLGAITDTLEQLPGLLVLVPAAIGLRGNIFSTFGNRLSTAIHTGQFEFTARRDSVLIQNMLSALVLTGAISLGLAVLAKVVAIAVGIEGTISLPTLAMISILGGLLASLVVLAVTVALVWGATRFEWDLDNVVAPAVSTLGDVLTVPALWLATLLVDIPIVTSLLGVVLSAAALAAFGYGLLVGPQLTRQITRESWPILLAAAAVAILAGVVLERRLDLLAVFPALLVLQPAFVSSAGALGGILSSRLSSKLHLGLTTPAGVPESDARLDAASLLLLGLPVYCYNGLGAHLTALAAGLTSPGLVPMLVVSLTAGLFAVMFVLTVAYYGTAAAVVLRVDPDNYGIPIVTSSVDFVGSVALLVAVVGLGVAA